MHRLHLNFHICPSNVKGFNNLGLIIAFSVQFSFISFDLEQFLSLNFHDLDTFEDYRPVVLHNAP